MRAKILAGRIFVKYFSVSVSTKKKLSYNAHTVACELMDIYYYEYKFFVGALSFSPPKSYEELFHPGLVGICKHCKQPCSTVFIAGNIALHPECFMVRLRKGYANRIIRMKPARFVRRDVDHDALFFVMKTQAYVDIGCEIVPPEAYAVLFLRDNDLGECIVCYDECQTSTHCSHQLCAGCLKQMFVRKRNMFKCPYCREAIPSCVYYKAEYI